MAGSASGGGIRNLIKGIGSKAASAKASSGKSSGSDVPQLKGAEIPGGSVSAKSPATKGSPARGNPGNSTAYQGQDPAMQAMENSQGMFAQLMSQAQAGSAPKGVARRIQTHNLSYPTQQIDTKAFLKGIKNVKYRNQLKEHLGE